MTGFLESRATSHRSSIVRKLFRIIIDKKSNLCASLDVDTADELLKLADQVGPYVCMIKTHCDATINFTMETVAQLKRLAEKHEFLIFEDRKFADIGNTVKNQYQHGPFQIVQWADLTNCHGVFGPGIIKGLKEAAATVDQPRGLLMLAELSAKDNLAHGEYTKGCIKIAETDPDFCIGFIAQHGVPSEHEWVVLTPGVGLDDKGDNLGQQYRTVDDAVSSGSDVIIVGRGLFGKGRDPVEQAERYRSAGWEALLKRE